jgi:hypothetical protein
MRTALAASVLASLLAAAPPADAAKKIFTVGDPRGDDHGDGWLVYPLRDDMGPGDLDVLSFSARKAKDGTDFEIVFANPVRKPDERVLDVGGTKVSDICKLGFYTFNVDIYIDMDREPGSGSTNALPGRNVTIHRDDAWEKVILLNPRPNPARDALRRMILTDIRREKKEEGERLGQDAIDLLRNDIKDEVDGRVFFPTEVASLGQKIRFTVPEWFLEGPASADWAYTVLVTGAVVEARFDVPPGDLIGFRPAGFLLIPRGPAPSEETFGGSREGEGDLQSPIVDYVAPPGASQEEILRGYDLKTDAPAVLRGVVPSRAE